LANSYVRTLSVNNSLYFIGVNSPANTAGTAYGIVGGYGAYMNPQYFDGSDHWHYMDGSYPFMIGNSVRPAKINGVTLATNMGSSMFLNGAGYYTTLTSANAGVYTLYLNKTTLSGTSFPINANYSGTSDIDLGLATVAWSGSYNDLSNKPSIPTVNSSQITL